MSFSTDCAKSNDYVTRLMDSCFDVQYLTNSFWCQVGKYLNSVKCLVKSATNHYWTIFFFTIYVHKSENQATTVIIRINHEGNYALKICFWQEGWLLSIYQLLSIRWIHFISFLKVFCFDINPIVLIKCMPLSTIYLPINILSCTC